MKLGTALVAGAIAADSAIADLPKSDEKLAFAFLLSRHGARAPQENMDMGLFADDFAEFPVAHD